MKTDPVKYILVPEKELKLLTSIKKNDLTKEDWLNLIENEISIKRWLLKSKLSYQLSLSLGTAKGNENEIYVSMKVVDELITSLGSITKSIEKYNTEKDLNKSE